ncbi:PAS domain-containing protein [Geovibrio thiophilus]|uniref:HTH-type transcriptional regulatory protein TyrR n=1 Tax=Geovibrio thiophilus TaxID=139438 RepID=A0A410JX41_9BACT|nr:sigma 54-interacting transcriptional regulator [Geovibrio thiophilus]QAR32649.1 PAS domain-containing protein [Geovibrio thiophilus]
MDNSERRSFSDNFENTGKLHLEAFHKTQVDIGGDGVITVDLNGTVILADMVTKNNLDIFPGHLLCNHYPALWEVVQTVLKNKRAKTEIHINKGELEYTVNVRPIFAESDVIGAVCIFSPNTELEAVSRAMQSFKEFSRELSAILNATSEGLTVCDKDGVILRINPASERISNLKSGEVVGLHIADLLDARMLKQSAAARVLKHKEVVNMLEMTDDGRKIIKTGIPVFDESGELFRVVVSERDITEIDDLQRKLEEQAALSSQLQNEMVQMQQSELKSIQIIAKSPAMVKSLARALKASTSDSTVLILGESGTGKGLFADLIHQNSSRSLKPLIKINCGAIPESLIESELFGHEKGAFTGAQAAKPGYLEMADGGTLFLDEIAELPLASQVKLLRFLEDGRVTRLGATKSRSLNVRILAATHRNLEKMVADRKFRLDLFYRLNVIQLHVPPLRERRECIIFLVRHYLDLFSAKRGVKKRISNAALDILHSYSWPGNVRELVNICESMVVMSETDLLGIQDLPQRMQGTVVIEMLPAGNISLQEAMDSYERSILSNAVKEYGSQHKAAKALGVNQSTIARKLQKYKIEL